MAVKMRLTRLGDKKSPFYRIVVVDSRKARDAEYIDKVGHYNPTSQPVELVIDKDKAKDWLSKGVQPTETVSHRKAYETFRAQDQDEKKEITRGFDLCWI